MLEGPEIEAHRHKTGHSHVDLILGGTAVFLSMVSVFIAVRHGETMERLVAANSWPNISYSTGNESEGHPKTITLSVRNTGVGPARIDTFEVFYKDRPVQRFSQLLKACCDAATPNFSMSLVRHEVLPARDSIDFVTLQADVNDPKVWAALDRARFNVRVRACYCSVFDECWVMDSVAPRPKRVEECVASQPLQYAQ